MLILPLIFVSLPLICGADNSVRQPFCWSDFEDISSRALVAPVVVRAFCTVIYSRGSLPQFNASFHVTKILKSSLAVKKQLEETPRINLHFGMLDGWTESPGSLNDVYERDEMKGKSCSIPKSELQKEYILFLQPHVVEEDQENEIADQPDQVGRTWNIFAKPELFAKESEIQIQKALKRGEFIPGLCDVF